MRSGVSVSAVAVSEESEKLVESEHVHGERDAVRSRMVLRPRVATSHGTKG